MSKIFLNKIEINLKKNILILNNIESNYKTQILKYEKILPFTRNPLKINKIYELYYTEIRKFEYQNKDNILIQGDSWAQASIINKKIYNDLLRFSKKNNIGLINSGTGGYSITPMLSQLKILKSEYKIKPTIIICIIDQTDIGDEIYRFTNINNKLLPNQYILRNIINDNFKNIDKTKSFNTYKSYLYLKSYLQYRYKISNQSISNTIKGLIFSIKIKLKSSLKILEPLKNEDSKQEIKIFNERLNKYIQFAFENLEPKKLIFVTHPHKNHILDSDNKKFYKTNIKNLVQKVISKSIFVENIVHIDFYKDGEFIKKNDYENLFKKNDILSHLSDESYENYYYPYILKTLDKNF